MTNAHSFGGRAHTREEKAKKTYHDTDFLWFDCQASTVINVDTQLNEYAGIICSLFSSRSRSSSGRSQSCYCCFCCGCWSYCCWSCRSNYKHLDMLSERVVHALDSLRLWVWPSLWSSLQHGDFNCQRINVSTFIVAFEVCHRCVCAFFSLLHCFTIDLQVSLRYTCLSLSFLSFAAVYFFLMAKIKAKLWYFKHRLPPKILFKQFGSCTFRKRMNWWCFGQSFN